MPRLWGSPTETPIAPSLCRGFSPQRRDRLATCPPSLSVSSTPPRFPVPRRLGYSTGPTVQVTEAHFFPDFQFDNFGWKSVWNVKILKKLLKLSVLDVTTYSALPCPGQPVAGSLPWALWCCVCACGHCCDTSVCVCVRAHACFQALLPGRLLPSVG